MNTTEDKLTNNNIKWYGHILQTHKHRISKVLKMKQTGEYSTGRLRSRWRQKVSKDAAWEKTEKEPREIRGR
jgi:hypothetical protein